MTTSKKQAKRNAKADTLAIALAASGKPAKAAKPIKPGKSLVVHTGEALPVAIALAADVAVKPVKALSDEKQQLNAAFIAKLPTARPIFQAKYKPLNLAAHKPQSATERDNAYIHAIRTVYAETPFTHKQSGSDSGNLARAISLGLISEAGTNESGELLYTAVANKA